MKILFLTACILLIFGGVCHSAGDFSSEEEAVASSNPTIDLSSYAKDALAKYPKGPAKTLFAEGERLRDKNWWKEAGGCYLAIIKNFPADDSVISAQYKLGLIYGDLKAFTQGISVLKDVIKNDPHNELAGDSLYIIAYYYMSMESYGNATKYLQRLIGSFPNSPRVPWAKKDLELIEQELEKKEAEEDAEKKKTLLEKENKIHSIDNKIPIHE